MSHESFTGTCPSKCLQFAKCDRERERELINPSVRTWIDEKKVYSVSILFKGTQQKIARLNFFFIARHKKSVLAKSKSSHCLTSGLFPLNTFWRDVRDDIHGATLGRKGQGLGLGTIRCVFDKLFLLNRCWEPVKHDLSEDSL